MATAQHTKVSKRSAAAVEREAHWRGVLKEQRESGLNHSEFCRRRSIRPHSYFWWKREIAARDERRRKRKGKPRQRGRRKNESPSLVRVTVSTPEAAIGFGGFEVVLSNGRIVRVPASFDGESLKRLLAVVEEERC